ncbi:MAG: hypothetical protein NTW75_07930 [Planctomycetales bacterium]|nr:hypothetical protein [Planctomycetales bacterium]
MKPIFCKFVQASIAMGLGLGVGPATGADETPSTVRVSGERNIVTAVQQSPRSRKPAPKSNPLTNPVLPTSLHPAEEGRVVMVGYGGSHFETKPAATVAQAAPIPKTKPAATVAQAAPIPKTKPAATVAQAAPIPKTKPAATIIQAVTTEDHSEGFAVVQNDPVLDRRSETTVGQAATEDYFQADCRQRFSRHCPSMREQRCHSMRCQPGLCNHNQTGQAMCCYLRSKFGYFIPSGAGGAGVPLVGKYSRVYPQDPHYFDQRDGEIWAAQGYGAPMAVPLAPVVGHSFNYGVGIPSSRLTPISHPAY